MDTLFDRIAAVDYLPYETLREDIKDERFLYERDPVHYHTHTFWVIWHDVDCGSNQAVFDSLGDLCDWITDCGGFSGEELFIVEEVSSIKR